MAKRIRDPITGKMTWAKPDPEEVKADLLAQVDQCVTMFANRRLVSIANRHKHLKYRLAREFGIDAKPLY